MAELTPLSTIQKGELAQLRVIARAVERGYVVSRPFGEGARYDLVLDDGERMHRVQVKYSAYEVRPGAFYVELKKHTGGYNRRLYTYSRREIDVVIVYLPTVEAFAWLPPSLWEAKNGVVIRTRPTLNGQASGVNFLGDYLW